MLEEQEFLLGGQDDKKLSVKQVSSGQIRHSFSENYYTNALI